MSSPASPTSETSTIAIRPLTRDEANALWAECIKELDLVACFGVDTDPQRIGGEKWAAILEDGVVVGITWLKRWIKNSEAVIAMGRALLPQFRQGGRGNAHRDAIRAWLKAEYPGCKTAIVIVYNTNKASIRFQVTQPGARIVGTVPCGNGVVLYIFVLQEWN